MRQRRRWGLRDAGATCAAELIGASAFSSRKTFRSHVGGVGVGYNRESKLKRGCPAYDGVNLRRKCSRMAAF